MTPIPDVVETSAPDPPRRSVTVLRIVGALAVPLLALAVGWSAVFGAARVSARPAVFLGAGLAGYAVVAAVGGWLLTRRLAGPARRRSRRVGALLLAAVVLLPAGWTVARPADRPPTGTPPPGLSWWRLPDGPRLAALRVPARPAATGDPVVFLHGGPGVADMDHDAPVFGALAETGHDVWLYDQIGTGRSDRLADPTGYSLQRDVTDLEQVRQLIDADRMILIGHSYGATVAAHYLARHPDRVSRVVFSSPGRLVPKVGDLAGNGVAAHLTTRQRLAVAGSMASPRALLTWSLVRADPRAAHAFSSDDEMDARFATLHRRSTPGLVCPGSSAPPAPYRPGFYANQVPLASTTPAPDVRPRLRDLRLPALVLKGACDYLPWSFATDYRRNLPGSQLVYFRHAGHQIYHEQRDDYLATITAFLTDTALPLPALEAHEPPTDYRGPR